jgi:L-lactate utilization protein LutB
MTEMPDITQQDLDNAASGVWPHERDDPSMGWHQEYLKDQALDKLRDQVKEMREEAVTALMHATNHTERSVAATGVTVLDDVLIVIQELKEE